MPKINELSPHVADLIAAGEVVERPASVVKELVENAIDAGATAVTVEIRDGGLTFIRVTDNGCGISPDDAEIAFLRHATSKIQNEDDLAAISTLGFRGEALAAIASVSKIDMLTRRAGDGFGTAISLEAGKVTSKAQAGCPEGTTILVRDLFYNTPARLKFMKRDSAEGASIAAGVSKQALSHPEVSIKFIRNGREEMHTAGDGSLSSCIYGVLGRDFALTLINTEITFGEVCVKGFVSKPVEGKGNRNYQFFYVNGRNIKSRTLAAALEEGYKNRIMAGKYPSCVLHIYVKPNSMDVNVHPAKTEVKFLKEREVFEAVYNFVLGALDNDKRPAMELKAAVPKQDFYKEMSAAENQKAYGTGGYNTAVSGSPYSEQVKTAPVHDSFRSVYSPSLSTPAVYSEPAAENIVMDLDVRMPPIVIMADIEDKAEKTESLTVSGAECYDAPAGAQPAEAVTERQAEDYRVIGEALGTYIIVEEADGLVLIDKHAAHERVIFEQLKSRENELMAQTLLSPIIISPQKEELAALLDNTRLLDDLGFELEDFGGGSIIIRSIPAELGQCEAEDAVFELAAKLVEFGRADLVQRRDELLHTVACKAAIKGGSKSAPEELSALVRQVMTNKDIKYCPHGRPVAFSLNRSALEKQFRRT